VHDNFLVPILSSIGTDFLLDLLGCVATQGTNMDLVNNRRNHQVTVPVILAGASKGVTNGW
jgi:hypothetical protein